MNKKIIRISNNHYDKRFIPLYPKKEHLSIADIGGFLFSFFIVIYSYGNIVLCQKIIYNGYGY